MNFWWRKALVNSANHWWFSPNYTIQILTISCDMHKYRKQTSRNSPQFYLPKVSDEKFAIVFLYQNLRYTVHIRVKCYRCRSNVLTVLYRFIAAATTTYSILSKKYSYYAMATTKPL